MDIDEELHKIQTPAELHASRPEFQEFPLKVFRDHIYKELKAQKQLHWNTAKEFQDEDDNEEGEGKFSEDKNEERKFTVLSWPFPRKTRLLTS